VVVSVVTLGELQLGIQLAPDDATRAQRVRTLSVVQTSFEPLPIDAAVAEAWASLVAALRSLGRRVPANDSWIAATALANGLPVITQDLDYAAMPMIRVIAV